MFSCFNDKLDKIFKKIVSNDTNENTLFSLFKIALIGIAIVFVFNLLFNREGLGAWGDFFGGVLNPILTFLTFMGLLITIVLQQKELKEARGEFARQSDALEKQQYEMTVQSFDNKFFQMLELFNFVKINVKSEFDFKKQREKLESFIVETIEQNQQNIDKNYYSFFESNFVRFNNEYDTTFKYYFLNLFQLLKYIDDNADSLEDAKEYSNIIRAQLSKDELVLLLLNCIGVQKFTTDDYQKLVEKFEFFEHLRWNDLTINKKVNPVIDALVVKYDRKVFGKNEGMLQQFKYAQERTKNKDKTNDTV